MKPRRSCIGQVGVRSLKLKLAVVKRQTYVRCIGQVGVRSLKLMINDWWDGGNFVVLAK